MNLMDIVALAKQGFTPADVKELLSAGETPQESEIVPVSAESSSDQKTVQRDDQQDTEQVEVGDAVDYKQKFEELEAKYEQMQKDLQAAQVNNTRNIDVSFQNEKSYEETIGDLARSFM